MSAVFGAPTGAVRDTGTAAVPNGKLTLDFVVRALVADGLMSTTDAERILSVGARTTPIHPLVLIAEMNLRSPAAGREPLDLERLTRWLAERASLPYHTIDPLRVEFARVAEVMSSTYATSHAILPLTVSGAEVVVATSEPFVDGWQAEIQRIARKPVRRVVANPLDIARYTVEFYKLAQSIKNANRNSVNTASLVTNFEQLIELGSKVEADNAHVVTVVDWLLQYAFDQRASDIHLEPKREQGLVRFRIDGVLHQVYQVPPAVMTAMIARLKLLGRMDVVEKRRPLDGRIKTRAISGVQAGREVELRLSTLPVAFGEKLVIRIFDPEVVVRGYGELGFTEAETVAWHELMRRPSGIVLVTGPTGSGKTTTLYSTLRELATDEVNVSTIEDPIENVDPRLNQMQVQHGIDLGFADGLRALMRQDPDVIMVGEIRDRETADMTVQAALTGHLEFSTLHTNDAVSSIARLHELGVPNYLINATVIGVLAQRLVRILCPHCKQPGPPPDTEVWDALVSPWRSPPPKSVYRPVGCLECRRTGYLGRTGLIEMLVLSDRMRQLISTDFDLEAMRTQAGRDGLRSLRVSGAEKIARGQTTLEEVLRAAPPFMQ